MTVPPESAGTLSRSEKQALLRKILLEKIGRTRTAPASFAQERLWFIDRLEPGSAVYNMPMAWRLGGALDPAALERALGEIVRRHEALRTTFGEVDGSPVQVIAPFGGFALAVEDLSALGAADREAALGRRAGEEARRAFDLSAGPLFRAALLRLGAEDHVLLLSMHHVVSDGWSMGVLLRELSALYAAYREGRESPLPELGLQYADYAVRQREQLKGEALERQLGYWRERLAGAPELLELPADHPRPPVQTFRGAEVPVELSLELLERLQALGRSERATPYMVLLSAFQVLLSKYSGSDDIVVGSPVAGRTSKEVAGLIGFFVNTLVLRTDLSGNPTFREVLRRVRELTLGAYEHQELPFEKLVAELRPERSLSHSPLLQVTFTLEDAEDTGGGLAGLSVRGVETGLALAKLDLSLTLAATAQGLRGVLAYSTDLWEAATMRRLVGHFTRLVEQAAADPDARISRVTLLDGAEGRQAVEEWNRTSAEPPTGACIHERFAEQATRTPAGLAVVSGEDALTYRELDARANRLARRLVALGAGPEVRVGICLERSAEMVVAMLAVLKAGAAYLPLDPAYPADRLAYMLADSGAPLLVTQASLGGLLPGEGVRSVRVDADAAEIAGEPDVAPRTVVAPQNAAYVIYTSGSTGRPKGVVVTHANAANLLPRAVETFGVEPGGVVLQTASSSFDASLLEVFVALLSGAALHVAGREVVLSPERLAALLREREIDVWVSTPALLDSLLEEDFPALRTISTGGDRCSAETAARWSRGRRLFNMYGPTETTIYTTAHLCAPGVAEAPPIGRPVANARVYVLDAWGEPVPAGVPGELHVGGAGVARGYLGRAALTAERFVPDSFGGEAGGRLYRTGDRARWRADGELEFLGRTDAQVKIRGIRIEPGEVESALLEHPGVREAVVVAREAPSGIAGDRRLVGYVVAAPGEILVPAALREHLRARLPEHMVPAAVVELESLPLTPSGKLDRKALPEPEFEGDRYVAPRTPVEEVLAGIWAEVLRLERVGIRDDFFALGGHSLLATRVVARVGAVLGVEIPLRALFAAPTVAELAGRVEEMRRAGEGVALPPLFPVARVAPLPLSFAQERLWFLHAMQPDEVGYNMSFPARLVGRLDAAALERALGALAERHESLRTTFRPVERGAVQVVHPAAPAHLPVLDLTGLAPQAREREARRLALEDAARPFDLEHGPLLRATLVRLADEEHVLLLSMHHIVSDGWSMGVLQRDLFTLYDSFSRGPESRPPPLPPLPVQYADFAVWQRGWLHGDALQRQLDWWRTHLDGAPPGLELPTDRPRPAVVSGRGALIHLRVPAETTSSLRALARHEGATLYMVTRAALDLLLSRWSGQEDLVVGSPIANRTRVELDGIIGFFVNTLALRTDLSGDPTFRELLGRVREVTLGAYAHQDLPFERLVEEVAPERSLSHTPLFQVMFALQNAEVEAAPSLEGLRLEQFPLEWNSAVFDLGLDLLETNGELVGAIRFRTDLFDPATALRMAAQYQTLLGAVCASPEERLSRLAILSDEEVSRILAFGGGSARDGTGDAPVHLLFAEQAARTPEAPAVLFAGESLTYAELDERANRLARELRSRGIGAGTTVAVCLERGPGVLVAPLAVWKAGGVYLPLDPAHPAERLSFLLGDSGAALVVTERALAGVLPEREAEVVLLDAIPTPREGAEEGGALAAEVLPGDLAYLIYTSGSTGTPKAVMVEHAQLTHTLRASLETLGFAPGDVVAALASTAFDISLLELVTPLLAGAATRVVPRALVQDPGELVDAVADATVLHAVPALMRHVVEVVRGGQMLPSLRLLLVGGDTVPPDLLEDMREVFPAAQTRVLYGPTEGTIICATYAVPAEGAVAGHPLGRPLPGVRLRVSGPRGEMAPVGVPGEVWISGGGVARGYLGRPELNAETFVSIEGERAYRTGDRARWRTDGVLEFLGRTDEQVKVRGFRIEPGEVEAVLRGQPGVREAVVLAREDAPGDRRLVAYVVPGADGVETAAGKKQVAEWETLFDDTYAQDEGEDDPTLQLKGWNSSYTGEPIPREEMRAWVEHTAERILALRPERVLEIGSGTGLLLFRVAPYTRAYHGTDFSGVALAHVRRHAAGLPQVTLSEREADRLDDYTGAGFDTVVINSVAQYFPDVDYLLRVLEGAAAALRPGGRIFVGDVRSLPLAGAFHASVELARAPEGLPIEQLQARVRRGMAEEQELLLDPALFEALQARMPRLGRVEVQVKRGEYDNEVSRFRYDVVLHLDAAAAATAPVVREWSGEDAAGLRALAEGSASALLVRGVPDARVRAHVRAYERVSAGGGAADAAAVRALAAADAGGIAPEALFALGGEMGRAVEVRPGASGTLDVLFHPAGGVARFPAAVDAEQPWEAYANDPQWGRRMRALVPALREAARARLPEYMVPNAFLVLEALPVTPNGKVDRAALPAPDTPGSRGEAYVAPRTPAEERMAGIWAQVLGMERVGGEDNFFELGGHSLLATQLVSRVREAFRTELPLRAVFEAPTLAELAGRVEALVAETRGDAAAPPLVPVPRDGSPLPLSFAQQRLWFIEQLEPGSTAYHMPSALRLRGPLDARVLERALGEVVRRHEALRTTFGESEGVPFQVVHPAGAAWLEVTDLSSLAAEEREAEARRLAVEEAQRLFDLRAGPLLRTRLLRLGEDDHVLVLAMHHVVSDGWSMGVLDRELGVLYEAFARGEASPLPEPPVQYADFAVWQRAWLSGEVLERQIAWWRERLAGAPPLLELPTDHPRAATLDSRAGHVFRALPPGTAEGVRALARREGATLYMVLLAALDLLLARWSGQDDVVVGTPIANRTRRETEGLIGFFVNTLALRTDLSGNPSFQALLRRVRETTLGAYQHQEVPFERLVEELQVERSLSHTPLFQVMFSLIDGAGVARPFSGLEVELYPIGGGAAKFDLDVMVVEQEGGLGVGFTYREELWDASTLERLAGAYALLLEAAAADASRRVLDIPLMADAERQRLLRDWNPTAAELPRKCIHELFAEQAARTPQAVAVVFQDASVTYAELDRRSDTLARRLAALGVGAEVRVGICLERGVEMVVGLLGILKAGGAYVPLDPQYPAERLAYILADAGATLLLAQERLRDRLPAFGGEVVLLDGDAGDDVRSAEPRTASPENLAYVIYTSGSTGLPKGTEVPHRAIPGFFRGAEYARFGEGAVVLQHSSVSWDALTLELWPAILSGGTCVLYPGQASEPGVLGEQVRRQGVNTLWLTAAYFNLIVDTAPEILAGVAQVMTGGEAVSVPHVRRALELYPRLRLVNGYGPSETTVFATCYPVPADFDAASVPLGRPVGDRRVYLLDGRGEPVPEGVAGELCIGGPAVARGYLGRPGLTAERFVPDPFGEPGARLYRSGDRARWRETASAEVRECGSALDSAHDPRTPALPHPRTAVLEFVGRTDFQVKIRGFRVEPGEIEARLAGHPGVREAAVVVRAEADGEKRLVAYYVAAEGVEPEALRAHLAELLPGHMVPAAYVRLEALPLTPHGKLDQRALPAPEGEAYARQAYEAPVGEVESALAGIWAEVLRIERVGRWDHFFDLGGHSLLATRVASRIAGVLGVQVPLRAVFEAPALAELARRVESLRAETRGGSGAPPLVPVPRDGLPLPLSFAQQRLWFIEQLEPGSIAYHLPSALRLRGPLDARVLERALGEVVRRHEALRTTFDESGGEPFQVVHPAGAARLELTDLSGLAPAEREAEALRLAEEEAQRPFDLRAGPLFRSRLLRLGEDDHVLVLAMHHVVSDGWSMEVLSGELGALYEAFARGEPSPLPELPVQYADFAVWQRAWLSGEVLEREIAWWRERLEGAPPVLELPTDHARPAMPGPRAGHVFRALPPETAEGVRALARREGATPYMVLLAALDLLLARWSGQEDVVVGTPIANRTRRETEGLIGFFVNTLALRTDLSGNPSFQALLGRVRETTLGAYQHQDVPFERLVDELRVERSLSHTPLFQVMFSLIDGADAARPFGGLEAEPYPWGAGVAKFDLDVLVMEQEGGLGIGFTWREELWDASTLERVAAAYALLLEAAAADPGRPVLALPLVSDAERENLLAGSSGPLRDYPAGLCVHDLFAAQAARTPHAVALSWRGERVTYAELEARANRLANHLRRLGVGPETRVGICLERGPELVVTMLGVLKAGGAYVPLDPAYPRERLATMQEDAGVTRVITGSALADRLPESAAGVLLLDLERDAIAAESAAAPQSGAVAENLSHVIFTSGSTGRPKGVMTRHASTVVLLHWLRENVTDEERASVLFSTSINFDVSVAEVFGTLCWGGKLVIAENALELATLGEEVVYASMVPSAAAELLKSGGIPACVKTLNLGGEALPNALAQGLYALETVEKVGNLYGPTEDTTYSTYYVVPRGADPMLIGTPVANTQAYVLDHHLQPVPMGMAGELYLAGDGLSRGYANQPALTAERFVPCPFGAPGGRMYRVMDRVRRRTDGALEYLGRTDHQVKVRGFRIEPGEIEAALRRARGVGECAVVAREDAPGDRRLVAYVVGEAKAEALRDHLRQSLPEYMVPAAFVFLDALPMTPNGKLDRKALPAPEPASAEETYVAPRRPLEAALAEIWAEVLGCARVGVKENFFDLGGHSLLLVKVQARLREVLDRKIPVVDLFRFPTVAALAEHLGGEGEGAGEPQAGAEGRRRRGRDRAAVRRALAGQSGGTTHDGDEP